MENLPENTSPTQIPKWLIIAGVIVIFFLLLLLGWWAYNRLFQTQTAIENQNTNGWTDYTSQKCKYQVSYPPAWYIYTDAEQEDLAAVLITSSPVQSEVVDDLNSNRIIKGILYFPCQQSCCYYQYCSIKLQSNRYGRNSS